MPALRLLVFLIFLANANTGLADEFPRGQWQVVEADFSERTEVHSVTMTDEGVMQMRPVEGGLEIGAEGELMLEPGGYHIMFMGLSEQLKEGEHHLVTLNFEKAGAVTLEFVVQRRDSAMNHGGEMEMDSMAHDEEEMQ